MSSLVWVELDVRKARRNLEEIAGKGGFRGLKCAVVKSNAYGHGVKEIVSGLTGADWFAVNSLEEGLELRGMGVEKPVLVMGHVPVNRLDEARQAGLRIVVYNFETLSALRQLPPSGKELFLHMKIETGTWRQGVLPEDTVRMAAGIKEIPGVRLEGIYTHFANIEDTLSHDYAQMQLDVFRRVLSGLDEHALKPPLAHTACTAAAVLFPKTHFSMIRVGIGVYGLWPSRETRLSADSLLQEKPDLQPVLRWMTRVVQIKRVPVGSYIGYGGTYRTTRDSVIAVLPVGYADGYRRALSNTGWVLIGGKRAPIVGRICMNLCMVDITDLQGVGLEDEVVLLGGSGGEEITAEMLAQWMGTINYEVVTGISSALPRKVVEGGV